ncbi:MAG: cytochrome c [Deltaproteobacteria bacterium]|nr:cytochrome c [Deltaproteobacteria bacterium]MBW2209704.1 cytochrome c [Deltaproteobacteria bacterium]MBW2212880.1 cytochrome c [Deltaproteobacteria bacterium]MBW2378266.1 cytochrome c [Deltaproteobacteria bacterium]MBW2549738.1 cytochrome c [Deltaproteobacteria bacterium]
MKAMGALLISLALSACSTGDASSTIDYGTVEVPVGRLSSDDARGRGRTLFRKRCALCHGERADGHGARREGLSGKPINFHNKEWRANVTPLRVFEVLSEGKRGTSMPAWPTLSTEQKWDVTAYVLSVAEDGP